MLQAKIPLQLKDNACLKKIKDSVYHDQDPVRQKEIIFFFKMKEREKHRDRGRKKPLSVCLFGVRRVF